MEPVLFDGQHVLVMKIKEYKRNDIIVFYDKSSGMNNVKYLFGLPGDRLGKSGLKFYKALPVSIRGPFQNNLHNIFGVLE